MLMRVKQKQESAAKAKRNSGCGVAKHPPAIRCLRGSGYRETAVCVFADVGVVAG